MQVLLLGLMSIVALPVICGINYGILLGITESIVVCIPRI